MYLIDEITKLEVLNMKVSDIIREIQLLYAYTTDIAI